MQMNKKMPYGMPTTPKPGISRMPKQKPTPGPAYTPPAMGGNPLPAKDARPMPMPSMPRNTGAMPKMPKNPNMSGTIGTQVEQPADSRLQIMDSLKRAFQKNKSKPQYFGGGQ